MVHKSLLPEGMNQVILLKTKDNFHKIYVTEGSLGFAVANRIRG